MVQAQAIVYMHNTRFSPYRVNSIPQLFTSSKNFACYDLYIITLRLPCIEELECGTQSPMRRCTCTYKVFQHSINDIGELMGVQLIKALGDSTSKVQVA